ncbi:hypothetical protein BV25DRAFT_1830504 [Artomyces pyxidatus]|uniref:Uncharacterized protein n=1 Tax=Artomyces pyxidatus TaxID=48021 RepID=A0ACB8SPC6_9AGAM|nr:hypothetical protein BV25DRAFT_1830504 [Artomyces pyxidatus]
MNFAPISRKKFLFTPAGDEYTPEDLARCFAQQPLDGIYKYLKPNRKSVYLPPVLYYGWTIKYDDIMETIARVCPEEIIYVNPNLDPSVRVPDARMTLAARDPIAALLKHIGLPDDSRIHYQRFVIDGNMNSSPGIAIGNNYQGMPMEHLPKLIEFFGKGQKPKYYLDRRKWKWVVVPFDEDEIAEMNSSEPVKEDREKTPTLPTAL